MKNDEVDMNRQLLAQHQQNWFNAIDKHNNDKHPERAQKRKDLDMEQQTLRMREAEQFMTQRTLLNEQQVSLQPTVSGGQNTPQKPLTKAQMILKLRGGLPNERQTPEEQMHSYPSRTRAPIQKVY